MLHRFQMIVFTIPQLAYSMQNFFLWLQKNSDPEIEQMLSNLGTVMVSIIIIVCMCVSSSKWPTLKTLSLEVTCRFVKRYVK